MPLLESELQRIKSELGYSLLTLQAEPYIGYTMVFEQVIQPYLQEGGDTTFTTVVAASAGGVSVDLVVADVTGFNVGDVVVVDDDELQEKSRIRAIDTVTDPLLPVVTVRLSGAHDSPPTRITVEGGLTIVRGLLRDLSAIDNPQSNHYQKLLSKAGIKKVDEIEFFGDGSGFTAKSNLDAVREYLRQQLATVLGLPYLRGMRQSGGSTVLY